jgi:hypothetical protein
MYGKDGKDLGLTVAEAEKSAYGFSLREVDESKPEIPMQLDMANQNINELLEVITVLENRIKPIMHGEHPNIKSDTKGEALVGGTTMISSQLYAHNDKLVGAIRKLVSMMDRIEL